MLGCVHEADTMANILQEGHAGFLRFKDTLSAFLAQIYLRMATFSDQTHQCFRLMGVELVNDENPFCLWVKVNGALDMLAKIDFSPTCSNGR